MQTIFLMDRIRCTSSDALTWATLLTLTTLFTCRGDEVAKTLNLLATKGKTFAGDGFGCEVKIFSLAFIDAKDF